MPDHDDRLSEILGDWYERREQGETLEPEDVVRAHPELAEPLRQRFAALEFVDLALRSGKKTTEGLPGQIGDYRIIREIGRGGMGVVFEAEQVSMKRRVALKVLAVAVTGTPEAIKRFQREARVAGRLQHTNLVPVYAMGEHAGYWYYAMELVRGRPLSHVIDDMRDLEDPHEPDTLSRVPICSVSDVK